MDLLEHVAEAMRVAACLVPALSPQRIEAFGVGDRFPHRTGIAISISIRFGDPIEDALRLVDSVIPAGHESLLDTEDGVAVVQGDAIFARLNGPIAPPVATVWVPLFGGSE